jgi:hypothetical protein
VYCALIVLAEPLADVLGQSDVIAVWAADLDNKIKEVHLKYCYPLHNRFKL